MENGFENSFASLKTCRGFIASDLVRLVKFSKHIARTNTTIFPLFILGYVIGKTHFCNFCAM